MFVYKIVNTVNGKIYIGQTIRSLSERLTEHCKKGSGCFALLGAIQKYGKDSFKIFLISRCDSVEEMNHREDYYIDIYDSLVPNGYNLKSGGNNKKLTEDVKNKIALAHTGKRHSEETIEKLRIVHKRENLSEETLNKMRNARLEKVTPEETKKKLVASSPNKKPIICNETGVVYESIGDAGRALSIKTYNIVHVLKGKSKTIFGLSFSYVTEK